MKKSEMWKNGLRQKNVAIKRNSQRKKKDSGRAMKTDRVHVFHHAICEALINVSLSLQHRLLAETLQPVLSHPLPPSLHLSFLLYPPSFFLLPPEFLSISSADTIPPSSGAISRNGRRRLQVKVRNLPACVFQREALSSN